MHGKTPADELDEVGTWPEVVVGGVDELPDCVGVAPAPVAVATVTASFMPLLQ